MAESLPISQSKYIFPTPSLQNLESSSLIISVIIGFSHTQHLRYLFTKKPEYKTESSLYKNLKKHFKDVNNPSKKAQKILKEKVYTVLEDIGLPLTGPYDMENTINRLSDYYNVLIRLLENGGTRVKYVQPMNKKPGKIPEINLLVINDASNNRNTVSYIENLELYVKPFGLFCIICNRFFLKKTHKCRHKYSCYACGRASWDFEEELFETSYSQKFLCKEIPDQWKTCQTCGTITKSKKCAKIHVSKKVNNCKNKRKCHSCNKTYVFKKDNPHKCKADQLCKVCFDYYSEKPPEQHYCKLREQSKPDYYPGLATWDVESTTKKEKVPLMCIVCADLEAEYLIKVKKTHSQLSREEKTSLLCKDHKNHDPDEKAFHSGTYLFTKFRVVKKMHRYSFISVNFCVLIYENEKRGYFNRITFADPLMNHPDDLKIEKNYYICPKNEYYCPEIFGNPISRKKIQTQKHRTEPIVKSSSHQFPIIFKNGNDVHSIGTKLNTHLWCESEEAKKLSVLDKFIIFTCRPEFRNQTYLSHNGAKYGMCILLTYTCNVINNR